VATWCQENAEGVETAREVLEWRKAGNSPGREGGSGVKETLERSERLREDCQGLRERPWQVNGAKTLKVRALPRGARPQGERRNRYGR
jgi:hypothetical protein